ncbi:MAG: hypothetical protein AUI12_14395 [Acidobacteria bacterium 13_2_20CM_2_57_6]|nr:MAG: hypothetical protein AUI12_14395 [Acidobacteria bacterium 13_2_20CM_2_57_6]PYT39287.1 MAG: hypothetical protein DMG45_20440 [Acidobacteriota bacterium]PYT43715.1 MAG: hypothetical protein DMG47_12835 [Acidobacteriota bacterium]PYT60676.1 MAG: hypothetical protein DMG46_06920 [Acidobacteriota bacterium]
MEARRTLGAGAVLSIRAAGAIMLYDCGKQMASAILSGLQYARRVRREWNQFQAKLTWHGFAPVLPWRATTRREK